MTAFDSLSNLIVENVTDHGVIPKNYIAYAFDGENFY